MRIEDFLTERMRSQFFQMTSEDQDRAQRLYEESEHEFDYMTEEERALNAIRVVCYSIRKRNEHA